MQLSITTSVRKIRKVCSVCLVLALMLFVSCQNQVVEEEEVINRPPSNVVHLDWSKNATIYEVNIRQYTPEGTFKAFEEHLPRLKELGIDILWFMPIHPVGEKNRKGTLGQLLCS